MQSEVKERTRDGSIQSGAYRGYDQRLQVSDNRPEALELLLTGPGTPMNEYFRRYWQPVCLSEQLTDVPKAIRILHEDLVAFRDRSRQVGVLHRRLLDQLHRGELHPHLRLALRTPRGRATMLSPLMMFVVFGLVLRQKANFGLGPESGLGLASFAFSRMSSAFSYAPASS